MRNKIGLRELFGDNRMAFEQFAYWLNKNSDELCIHDLEMVSLAYGLNSEKYVDEFIYFHHGSILDWLEELGYKIGLPVRNGKYVTCVYYGGKDPLYSNSGMKDRRSAIIKGIQNAIKHHTSLI